MKFGEQYNTNYEALTCVCIIPYKFLSLRCNSCYNHTTNQRNYDLLDIPLNIQPQRSTMEGDKLIIACKS